MQATLELIYRISLIRRRSYYLFHCLFLCGYYLRGVSITSVESPLVSMTASSGIYVQAGRFNEAWGYGAILSLDTLSTSWQLATMRWLIDAGSRMHSLSLPRSAVETSHRTWTFLALAWWPSSAIVCISVHVLCILAVATIWGWHLFCSELLLEFEGGNYLRAASNQRNIVKSASL